MALNEFKRKSDNPWDSLVIPTGQELKVGTRIYSGVRLMLIEGEEKQVSEPVYGGDYPLDNGKTITVVDGVITEIVDSPTQTTPIPGEAKAKATEARAKYKK